MCFNINLRTDTINFDKGFSEETGTVIINQIFLEFLWSLDKQYIFGAYLLASSSERLKLLFMYSEYLFITF